MTAFLRSLEINPNLFTELRTMPEIGAILEEAGKASVAAAKQIAPIGDPSDPHYHDGVKPGRYRRSIRYALAIADLPGIGKTLVCRVFSTDRKAHWIEYGGASFTVPLAVLRRSVEMSTNLQVSVVNG